MPGTQIKKTADEIIEQFDIQPAVLGYPKFWNILLEKKFPDELSKITRYHLPFSSHNRSITKKIDSVRDINIKKIEDIDYDTLNSVLGWEHHKHHYKDHNDFIKNGLGDEEISK